jgi:hypothetical protein
MAVFWAILVIKLVHSMYVGGSVKLCVINERSLLFEAAV